MSIGINISLDKDEDVGIFSHWHEDLEMYPNNKILKEELWKDIKKLNTNDLVWIQTKLSNLMSDKSRKAYQELRNEHLKLRKNESIRTIKRIKSGRRNKTKV